MSETKLIYEATVDTEGNLMYQVNEDGVQGAPILEVVGKEVTERNQDSAEMEQNYKGEVRLAVKVYFDGPGANDALDRLDAIVNRLRLTYCKEASQ